MTTDEKQSLVGKLGGLNYLAGMVVLTYAVGTNSTASAIAGFALLWFANETFNVAREISNRAE